MRQTDKFNHLLTFALTGLGEEIRQLQDNIVLVEKFGLDAVTHPNLYNPNRRYDGDKPENMKARMDELVAFAKEVEKLQDGVKGKMAQEFADSFKEFLSKKG